jgi:hypothetical protein
MFEAGPASSDAYMVNVCYLMKGFIRVHQDAFDIRTLVAVKTDSFKVSRIPMIVFGTSALLKVSDW